MLLEETRDILASTNFQLVLERCLDRSADVLFDGIRDNLFSPSQGQAVEDVRLRLAGMLPGLARWSSLALQGMPNVLVDVRCFSFQFEVLVIDLFAASRGAL